MTTLQMVLMMLAAMLVGVQLEEAIREALLIPCRACLITVAVNLLIFGGLVVGLITRDERVLLVLIPLNVLSLYWQGVVDAHDDGKRWKPDRFFIVQLVIALWSVFSAVGPQY